MSRSERISVLSAVLAGSYEALPGTLYSDLVFKEGSEWKFGTGTRNVNRNEPHGFRFLYWRDATRRNRDPRRGKASARAIVAAVHAANEDHIPCFPADQPGTTPGQIIMTNTKFQRDSLVQSLPTVKFPHPVRNPWYAPPANQGMDDSQTHAPPALRPKQGKGKGGKKPDKPLETVVKLSGSTCYRTMVIQDACGFLSGRRHRREASASRDSKLAQRFRSELMRLPIGLRAGQKSRTPANLSVALTKATAMWQSLDVADALSHTGAASSGSVLPHGPLHPRRGTTDSFISKCSQPRGHNRRC